MKPGLRLCLLAGLIAAGIVLLRVLGLGNYLSLDNVPAVAQAVEALGWIGPGAYVLLWIVVCLFFIPGLPITFLGAAVFGAWWGLLYVTFLCMIPASVAYCLAGGAVVSGQGSAKKTLLYLAVAAVLFVLASLIPGWVKRRYAAEVSGQTGAD
jgi:uncharacterized membrane protein YdjX (TVP38/TMEM64 family)